MAILKCKMCGGDLDIEAGVVVADCEYCGTKQTIPNVDNEKKMNLFNRANRLRFNNDFDKAMGVYESIVAEFPEEAESYWGLCLCKYGIEYVDDPATARKIPTCHRTSYDSIFDDQNFEMALEYADAVASKIYREEAREIERLQKAILDVVKKEEPFDIFICYKETDENGDRTMDSVLAQDVYDALTQKGYKVFFSRITLEDKLGQEYEPYIFAALTSAKVMLAFGTCYEYYNAVWVKNEWSRFLDMMKNDKEKYLIPCYKNIDAYDMPREFGKFQAQDLGKVGAVQDLVRGIEKLIGAKKSENAQAVQQVVVQQMGPDCENLLNRAFVFLEDGDWKAADEYCEKVLDIDFENARAYLGKLMASLRVKKQEALKHQKTPFDKNPYYQKLCRLAGEELQKELKGYIDFINERNENERLEGIYQKAKKQMGIATEQAYTEAAAAFESIKQYKDAATLAKECGEKIEALKNAERLAEQKYQELVAEYETLAKKVKSDSEVQEMKEKIEKLSKERDTLKALLETFPANSKELAETEKAIAEKKEKIEALHKERSGLGLFAGKRKKEIDENVSVLQKDANALETKRTQLKNALCGYSSVEEISKKISEAEVELPKLKLAVEESEKGRSTLANLEKEMCSEKYTWQNEKRALKLAKKGDKVVFGSYPQGKNTDKKEKIKWLVLEKQGGKVLLLSKYALDCKKYNEEDKGVTWETCTLRKWLNDTFLNTAFTKAERCMIPTVTVSADKNSEYSTNPGNSTRDQVFLLSIVEAKKYFSSGAERVCEATAYAKGKGASVGDNGASFWWLRSPGSHDDYAAGVDRGGSVWASGIYVNGAVVVRPALWVDLDAFES